MSGSNPIEHSRHSGTVHVVPDCRFYQCPISGVIFWIEQNTRRNPIVQNISYVGRDFEASQNFPVRVAILKLLEINTGHLRDGIRIRKRSFLIVGIKL